MQGFSAWAGKRSGRQNQGFSSWAGKRAPFNAWAGKRSGAGPIYHAPEYERFEQNPIQEKLNIHTRPPRACNSKTFHFCVASLLYGSFIHYGGQGGGFSPLTYEFLGLSDDLKYL